MNAKVELGWIRLWIITNEWRNEIMISCRNNYSIILKSSWNAMLLKIYLMGEQLRNNTMTV